VASSEIRSVMISMKPKIHSRKERSDKIYFAQPANSTTLKNDLGASTTHLRREVLYSKSGQGEIARLEAGFTACWSYAIWVTGTECSSVRVIISLGHSSVIFLQEYVTL
jgi:hypothetical protein